MEKLTKEQKMKMVSKAIDAGFRVELRKHRVKSDRELDELLLVFDKELSRRIDGIYEDSHAWLGINKDREFEDSFSAIIHFDSLRGEPS